MRKLLCIVLLAITCLLQAMAQGQLTGEIVDNEGIPVIMAAVCYEGNDIYTISDADGKFAIARREGRTINITCIGQRPFSLKIDRNTPAHLKIVMDADTQTLSEVVIKAKKERYRRKNNPAVELMKRVIAAKKKTDLENNDWLQYDKYQKISLAINDYKGSVVPDSTSHKRSKWDERTELSPYNGKVIMPLSVDETVTRHIYRKNPQKWKDIIEGEKSTGLNQMLSTGDMLNTALKEIFQDIDIYEDYVRMLQFPFISPIGGTAISFYRYYIKDTVMVDNDSCYHLTFIPNNQQDFGFSGDLWVLKDSTLHVKKCALTIPHKSDVNYIERIHIDQQFEKLDNGDWGLLSDDMWAELKLMNKSFLVVRNTRYNEYAFNPLPKKLFKGHAEVKHQRNAKTRDEEFWSKYRKVDLSENELTFDSFIARLEQSPQGKAALFVIKPFVENFFETSPADKPSMVDIGPFLNMISQNYVDGLRLSVGARTTAALNPHLFWNGYVAHGMRSAGNYYQSEFTYAFNKKEHSPFEFPQRNIIFESSYDLESPADKFLSNSKDNVIMGLRTQKVEEMYQYNRQKLSFVYETDFGFSAETWAKCELERPMGAMHYFRLSDGEEVDHIRTTELHGKLHYCSGLTFVNNKQKRLPMNLDSPEFTLKHTIGLKGVLGGQYMTNLTEIGFYKRQWLGSWGHIDLNLDAAAQWNKVPFPLLMMPPADLSYIDQQGTFAMMRNMEFLLDRKLMWQLHWNLNGKLFNRIPLLKHLKLREHIKFKGIWGELTDKNNPMLQANANDPDLFRFPDCTYVIDKNKPYMELSFGIHNIFKVLTVEFIDRLNYNDHANTQKYGIRFGIYLSF